MPKYRSLEINEILYEKQFGKKFVNEYDKRAKKDNFADEVSKDL